jgi:hypothetical protein
MFMKRQFSFLWVSFAILVACSGCSPAIQSNQTPQSALVKIECQNASVRQILELLRSGRGKDINVAMGNSCMEITAAFRPGDAPPGKLEQILQSLTDLSGVIHVEVEGNPHPIRQNF